MIIRGGGNPAQRPNKSKMYSFNATLELIGVNPFVFVKAQMYF